MECPNCLFENSLDSNFCTKCGIKLTPPDDISVPSTATFPTSPRQLITGSTFAHRYQVVEELGKGGMGRVYKVLDTKIKEKIALKVLTPEIAADRKTIERFGNELKMARRISHRNVCRMYHLGEEDGVHYITMEYIRGESLKDMIRMVGKLSPSQAVTIVIQVCEGLAEAHKLSVVHRDLKPSNIMIDRVGNIRIMDFGIARSLEAKGLTRAGMMIGTPAYMSPEQVEGKEADWRSDIYSLGVILYEMVTGRLPFEGDTPLSIALKHKTETPTDPRKVDSLIPEGISRVILKCLEKDKARRHQSADELLYELQGLEQTLPSAERVLPRSVRSTSKEIKKLSWKPWLAVFALVAVVVAAGIILLFSKRESPVSSPSERKMLVVLPLENLGSPEDEYFTDGLTEELTSRLSALHGLGVISRTSAKQYKGSGKTIKQIGEELGVDFILEGTVRWERSLDGKDQVRITPQLIRVSDDTHIWSERFDRDIKDIFTVQSEIAEQVARQLDITVLEPERKALIARPTDNLEAYDLYLKSVKYFDQGYLTRDAGEFERAIELLERAVRLDPDFTFAYIQLSKVHGLVYDMGIDRTEGRLAKARTALDRALELDRNLPEAQMALVSYYYSSRTNIDRIMEIYESVRRARPNITPSTIGYIQRRQGNWEEAVAYFEESFKLNPRNVIIAHNLGLSYMRMRRYEASGEWFNRALAINPKFYYSQLGKAELPYMSKGNTGESRVQLERLPLHILTDFRKFIVGLLERNYQDVLRYLASSPYDRFDESYFYIPKDLAQTMVYRAMNDQSLLVAHADAAREILERKIEEAPGDSRFHAALGLAYAYLGRKEDAIRAGSQAVNLYPVSSDAFGGPWYIFFLTVIYSVVGEHDDAISLLEYLMSIPAGNLVSVALLELDPNWDPLRSYPRFQRLLEVNPEVIRQ